MQPIKVIIFITKSKKGTKGNINLSKDRDTTLSLLPRLNSHTAYVSTLN